MLMLVVVVVVVIKARTLLKQLSIMLYSLTQLIIIVRLLVYLTMRGEKSIVINVDGTLIARHHLFKLLRPNFNKEVGTLFIMLLFSIKVHYHLNLTGTWN